MTILLIDNYDSFTYNLKHYLEQFDVEVIVKRNDELLIEECGEYDAIVLSPGPGLPQNAGIMMEVLKHWGKCRKILDICLGHQAIGLTYGAKLKNLENVLHGVARLTIRTRSDVKVFDKIPKKFLCARYHSWVVDTENFPSELEVLAIDEQANIMAIRHKEYNVYGLQYHPESILTEYGLTFIENWVKL